MHKSAQFLAQKSFAAQVFGYEQNKECICNCVEKMDERFCMLNTLSTVVFVKLIDHGSELKSNKWKAKFNEKHSPYKFEMKRLFCQTSFVSAHLYIRLSKLETVPFLETLSERVTTCLSSIIPRFWRKLINVDYFFYVKRDLCML